jgi:hypothetical protein
MVGQAGCSRLSRPVGPTRAEATAGLPAGFADEDGARAKADLEAELGLLKVPPPPLSRPRTYLAAESSVRPLRRGSLSFPWRRLFTPAIFDRTTTPQPSGPAPPVRAVRPRPRRLGEASRRYRSRPRVRGHDRARTYVEYVHHRRWVRVRVCLKLSKHMLCERVQLHL